MYDVELIVLPREGVLDPQSDAVAESLRTLEAADQDASGDSGAAAFEVECIGRYLKMKIDAASADEARSRVESFCDRLLVNPSLERHRIEVSPSAKDDQ